MSMLKEKYNNSVKKALIEKFKYGNVMSVPKLEKIVINRGLGEAVTNGKVVEYSLEQLRVLTGQKPVVCLSKKAISNFKIREKMAIGCKVTLRGQRMYDFLTKLLNISLPKIRDFRGMKKNSFDGRGNYTIGLKEDGIFPEMSSDSMDRARGFDITIVTTANTDKEAYELLELMGMPFRKD